MSWAEDWPSVLMWASVALFVGALFAIVRFVRNSSDSAQPQHRPDREGLQDVDPKRPRSAEGLVSMGLLIVLVVATIGATALAHGPGRDRPLPPNGVLWSVEALLRDFFPSSNRVVYQKISLTPDEQAELAALTGVERESGSQLLYVAQTGTRTDGYAFLEAAGPGVVAAEFGVKLGADGRVRRVEVVRLVDRDQYQVLDPRFLHQYEGARFPDAHHLHRKIDRPIGCTSACMNATKSVRRALFLVPRERSSGGGLPATDENGDPESAKKD